MDVIMPQLGETVAEGTVTKWYKKVGDVVKADDVLFDVETDKVSTEIPAQADGVLAEILVAEGATAKVGAKLAVIRESGAQRVQSPVPGPQSRAESQAGTATAAAPAVRAHAAAANKRLSPVVSRLLAEYNLDPRAINGTGRDGRITREDVLAHVAHRGSPQTAVRTEDPPRYAIAGEESVPLNSVRRRTAEHMTKSWTTVPHVLQVVEADFSRVDAARRAAGLTYLPFIAWAVTRALLKFPRLNASFRGDSLAVHKRVNLGIAVDLGHEGLLVPVVKDAGAKPLAELARAMNDLAERARANRLKPDDMTEGTYTLTNNGAYGTLITAPIISPPQVAILSTDAVRKRAVVVEEGGRDAIAVRPVGMLAQTFDHRAVDGAYAASFLNAVKTLIETHDWQKEL